ncbi:hypothetical protein P7C70_g4574, partial [Phenoliferia sp. Uapishka_3]
MVRRSLPSLSMRLVPHHSTPVASDPRRKTPASPSANRTLADAPSRTAGKYALAPAPGSGFPASATIALHLCVMQELRGQKYNTKELTTVELYFEMQRGLATLLEAVFSNNDAHITSLREMLDEGLRTIGERVRHCRSREATADEQSPERRDVLRRRRDGIVAKRPWVEVFGLDNDGHEVVVGLSALPKCTKCDSFPAYACEKGCRLEALKRGKFRVVGGEPKSSGPSAPRATRVMDDDHPHLGVPSLILPGGSSPARHLVPLLPAGRGWIKLETKRFKST